MFRRPMMRRGPGLVGTIARTAVIAGTATAVSGHMIGKQQQKAAAQQAAVADQQQDAAEAAQINDMQSQLNAMQSQQAAAAVAPAAAAAAPAANDIAGQLQQLQSLKTAGVLTDQEFETAKAKILGG